MNYTAEALDTVINATGASYADAKAALEACSGDADLAIAMLDTPGKKNGRIEEIKNKVKDIVKKGNATKITVTRNGETILSIPVNAGIVGGLVGLYAAPVAMVAAAIAAYGFDCRIAIENKDGSTDIVE